MIALTRTLTDGLHDLGKIVLSMFERHNIHKTAAAIVVIIFAHNYRSSVVPVTDTLLNFEVFFYTYSGFFYYDELPFWSPYGMHGARWLLDLLNQVSPAQYVIGLAGKMMGITDTLILYKTAVLFDILIFVGGMSSIAAYFLYNNLARLLLVLTATTFGMVWLSAPHFNGHIFYLMPWIIFYLLRYSITLELFNLQIAILIFILNFIGNLTYYIPLQFATLTIFFCTIMYARSGSLTWKKLGELFKYPYLYGSVLIAVAISIVITAAFLVIGETTVITRPKLYNTLGEFLTYAKQPISETLAGFIKGLEFKNEGRNSYYIGLFPLFLIFRGAVVKLRTPIYLASTIVTVFLFGLSVGGVIAASAYFFPGMFLYRHISLVFGLAGVFMAISAAVVLDHWIGAPSPIPVSPRCSLVYRRILKFFFILFIFDAAIIWLKEL